MELSVTEAATWLSRSSRSVRASLKAGRLPGFKRGGRWVVPSQSLPLDETARRALHAKADHIRDAVESVLPSRGEVDRRRRRDSLADLKIMRAVHGLLDAARSADDTRGRDELVDALGRAARCIARGHYDFDLDDKRDAFLAARRAVADAASALVIAPGRAPGGPLPDPAAVWLATIEGEILPLIGGWLRWIESRVKSEVWP